MRDPSVTGTPVWPLLATGGTAVVAGGLVAAATSLAPTEHGAWAAAYLVLVCGVAQLALALGQAPVARPPSRRTIGAELVAWNTGNVAVIAGTLAELSWLVTAGSVLLVVGLAVFARVFASRRPTHRSAPSRYAYPLLLGFLLMSVGTGTVLAHL